MIATLLSTKLDDLETKLETRSANRLYREPSGNRLDATRKGSFQGMNAGRIYNRRLLDGIDSIAALDTKSVQAANPKATTVKSGSLPQSLSLHHTLSSIAYAIASFVRLSSLIADQSDRPAKTANVMTGALSAAVSSMAKGHTPISTTVNPSSLGPAASKEKIRAVFATLQVELQRLLLDMVNKQLTEPLQIPQSLDTAPAPLMHPQSADLRMNHPPNMLPAAAELGISNYAKDGGPNSATQKSTFGLFPEHAVVRSNPLVPSAMNKSSGEFQPPQPDPEPADEQFVSNEDQLAHFQSEPSAFSRPETPVSSNLERHSPSHSRRGARSGPLLFSRASHATGIASSPPEAVEIWGLPNGKNVCRVYRSCRMQDGKVLLPLWMKRHSEQLKISCGLQDVNFVLENTHGAADGRQFAIRHLRNEFPVGVNLSLEHANRDVFGHTAPRDHMPHFVSDSFKPLASIEAILGGKKGRPASAVLDPRTGGGTPRNNVLAFTEVLPSLQLFEGTLHRPVTDWVPSVAEMFKSIGFEFSSAGSEKPDEKTAETTAKTGACFRSMITNNLKQYEPHGMFDASGQNVLFAANSLSRQDPASLPAMKAMPCTVTVTALTRQGPRALLGLTELDQTIAAMGQKLGIKAVFRAVDFKEGVSFEDQVKLMQTSNVLVAAHGAGNANYIFMRPKAAVIEVFPFSYRAGPFNMFAKVLGLDYRYAMSDPQTDVFKECMNRHEKREDIKRYAFHMWDQAVLMNKENAGVHRLQFESEFGKPGQSEGMTTRQCVRMQELGFDIPHVASMAIEMARQQCHRAQSV